MNPILDEADATVPHEHVHAPWMLARAWGDVLAVGVMIRTPADPTAVQGEVGVVGGRHRMEQGIADSSTSPVRAPVVADVRPRTGKFACNSSWPRVQGPGLFEMSSIFMGGFVSETETTMFPR